MKGRITRRPALSLSQKELDLLFPLTLISEGQYGTMWPQLMRLREKKIESDVYILRMHGEPVAWAHVYHDDFWERNTFHVYVRPDLRQQGLGRRIYEMANKRQGPLKVSRWNATATEFYNAVEGVRI